MDDDTLERLRLEVLFLQAQVRAMDAELEELRNYAEPKNMAAMIGPWHNLAEAFVPPARYGLGGWCRS